VDQEVNRDQQDLVEIEASQVLVDHLALPDHRDLPEHLDQEVKVDQEENQEALELQVSKNKIIPFTPAETNYLT
jgi:hypothetical protein